MYNQSQYDAVMNQLDTAKASDNRVPWIPAGQHDSLIVLSIEFRDTPKGYQAICKFEVERSQVAPQGTQFQRNFNLTKPSQFPGQAPPGQGDFVAFVCALQGIPDGQHQKAVRTLRDQQAAQPARGARISCTGVSVGNPNPKTGQQFVRLNWDTIQQDAQAIAACRAQLDARRPYVPSGAPAPQQPAQQQWGGQPQAQIAPPPYAAQGYQGQPQYQQATPNWQAQGPGVTTQTAQPMQQAPVGGFTSMLPPNNGGQGQR